VAKVATRVVAVVETTATTIRVETVVIATDSDPLHHQMLVKTREPLVEVLEA
jgi:hypothetical protein